MQKYFLAAKFGQGAVCSQIGIILEAYKYEQSKRHITASQKMANQNRNLDDFINVDH
jgi:hypothetical protein